LDAAHNPDGARALAEALPGVVDDPVTAVLAILADKDAEGIVAALAPAVARVVCAQMGAEDDVGGGPAREGRTASELAAVCARAGVEAEVVPELATAIARARGHAVRNRGTVLVTGSHYVLEPAREALA